jgi:hypothetical protein
MGLSDRADMIVLMMNLDFGLESLSNARRCAETGALEFDHTDGFARTRRHDVDRIRLLCRAHNRYAADQTYGRAFMTQARGARDPNLSRDKLTSRLL